MIKAHNHCVDKRGKVKENKGKFGLKGRNKALMFFHCKDKLMQCAAKWQPHLNNSKKLAKKGLNLALYKTKAFLKY